MSNIMDDIVLSTGRAISYVEPQTDRDAELMSCAYIGVMTKFEDEITHDDIVKIALGIQYGYKDLLKAVRDDREE